MKLKRYSPIILTIIIGVVGVALNGYFYIDWKNEDITVNTPVIQQVNDSNESLTLKNIIHETEKYVVQIEAQNEYSTLTGSGFLFNQKGDIITNAHVIQDSDVITVRTANARIYPAAVVGIDDTTDVAVLRVPQLAGESGLEIEKETLSEIGDEVIALGSPHGFQNTVTLGIISGTERNFSVDGYDYQNAYQISAQITHGNSGGPLLNRETGKVIGINSVGTQDGIIGFSIPIIDVIDQVERWSNETRNNQLHFASTEDLINSYDPDQLENDAEYIVEYFFDSILVRDYVGAYALLGDQMQSQTSYTDFREGYTQIVNLEYTYNSQELLDNNQLNITYHVSKESKLPNEQDTSVTEQQYEFVIGYENDQLKILSIAIIEK